MSYTDQYTSNQPEQQSILKDIALSPLHPTTYLYGYLDPRSFSQKKGVWTPASLSGKKWKSQMGNILSKEGGHLKFNAGKIWPAFKTLGPFGDNRIKGTNPTRMTNRIERLNRLKTGIDSRINWNTNEFFDYRESIEQVPLGKSKKFKKIRQKNEEIETITNKLKNEISQLKSKSSNVEKTIGGLTRRRNWTKFGLRVGKAGSIIGMGLLAYDIASAIGRPLFAAGMTALSNVATEYQNRFMPEIGGQLQLSYLSQGAATERQRAISSMSKAYINGRSAFGSESSLLHQGY